MGSIEGDVDGFGALAAVCQRQAAAMFGGGTSPALGNGFQATSAAVAVIHGATNPVQGRFADRLRLTGTRVETTAHRLMIQEAESRDTIAAVGEGLSVT